LCASLPVSVKEYFSVPVCPCLCFHIGL
jgi:hypothetical protein